MNEVKGRGKICPYAQLIAHHAMKTYGRMAVRLHKPRHWMEVSGKIYALAPLIAQKVSRYLAFCIGGWKGPRVHLDIMEKRNIS
jgi:hypothetical protein